jgi:hypothetical protein
LDGFRFRKLTVLDLPGGKGRMLNVSKSRTKRETWNVESGTHRAHVPFNASHRLETVHRTGGYRQDHPFDIYVVNRPAN